MKKFFYVLSIIIFSVSCNSSAQTMDNQVEFQKEDIMLDFYTLKTQTLEGDSFDFNSLKGKRILIVNTASECGYTPQYKELQALYNQYKDGNFVIIGFPSNDFGGQEPGSASDIKNFCERNYGVTFPMMKKVHTKGSQMDEVYQWLTSKSRNGVSDAEVKWNFHKFLIDENGKWMASLPSNVRPMDEPIVSFAAGK